MKIKMYSVGFGESILLSENNQCLLVDCGTEKSDYSFDEIKSDLSHFCNRSAMLTHFHNDHINGFVKMLDNGLTFKTVYIPHVFTTQHPNITDFEIVKYVLERMYCPGQNNKLTIWELLKSLSGKRQRIKLLQREKEAFICMNLDFDVLWPVPSKAISTRLFNKIFSTIGDVEWRKITDISDAINNMYLTLASQSGDVIFDDDYTRIDALIDNLRTINMSYEPQVFQEKVAKRLVQSIHDNANSVSIVCQCGGEKPLLMTGDIRNGIMKKIAINFDFKVPLLNYYYAIKAPHHGTDSCYFTFGCYAKFDNMLISNGETNQYKRGVISRQYNLVERNYKIYCTNTDERRCASCCISSRCGDCNIDKKSPHVLAE